MAFYSVAFFGLEWTVGISWAVPLDIGGDFAGSVSAVMNMLGNIGGALSALVGDQSGGAYRLECAVPRDERAVHHRGAALA